MEWGEVVVAVDLKASECETFTVHAVAPRARPDHRGAAEGVMVVGGYVSTGEVKPYVAVIAGDAFIVPVHWLVTEAAGVDTSSGAWVGLDVAR